MPQLKSPHPTSLKALSGWIIFSRASIKLTTCFYAVTDWRMPIASFCPQKSRITLLKTSLDAPIARLLLTSKGD
jgi:hypothetical protein